MSATLSTGTVKYPAKTYQTKHGERINAVVTLPSGEEVTLWSRPDDEALSSLKRGQTVQLVSDSKGYKLLEMPSTQPTSAPAPQIDSEQAYEELLRRVAGRYGKAIKAAKFIAARELDLDEVAIAEKPELIKEIAASLFIEANRQIR